MDTTYERWAATGTAAVVVAAMAATWAMCEAGIAWRDTLRVESIADTRGGAPDFEAYRPGPLYESATVWVAVACLVLAVAAVAVAGIRARRWAPQPTVLSAVCVAGMIATAVVLPFGPLVLLPATFVATMAIRDFARPAPRPDQGRLSSRSTMVPSP